MIDELQDLVRQYTDDEAVTITPDTSLLTDLGLNSYEVVQLACDVEARFGVTIPDRVISRFRTVQDVLDFLAARA